MFGPDSKASLSIDEITKLVEGVRAIEISLNHRIDKQDNARYSQLKSIFEKSLAVNKDLPKGHILTFEDLEAKKPKGYGVDASEYGSVVEKALSKELKAWAFVDEDSLKMEV